MAKCKLCKKNIPDGTEYCSDCQEKGNMKLNESYLDSLLNSVKSPSMAAENIYKKKNDVKRSKLEPHETDEEEETDAFTGTEDFDDYKVDFSDIEDFDQFFKDDDLDKVSIDDKELFGEDLTDIFKDSGNYQPSSGSQQSDYGNSKSTSDNTSAKYIEDADEADMLNTSNSQGNSIMPAIIPEEHEEEPEEEENGLDTDLNELLSSLGTYQNDIPADPEPASYNQQTTYVPDRIDEYEDKQSAPAEAEEFEQVEADDDDFLSLLSQISNDDPVADDVKVISDLLSGKPAAAPKSNTPSDVGEVFSDALKVVSSLNDPNINEEELLNKIPDKKEGKDKKKKKQKKASAKKPKKGSKKEASEGSDDNKPKMGLFQRLFGNVKDEQTAKKAQAVRLKNEEAAASSDGTKKARKGKKGASDTDSEEEASKGAPKGAKGKGKPAVEDDQEVKENSKDKKDKKAKKEKKKKEVIQVIDEIEEDEGRINRLGASIVFIFFGLLVVLLLVGTNVVSYTLSIQHATDYFDNHKYNQAYKEVYGVDIQDKDLVMYEKIMTVMFVNKQLNSYNNYYALHKYPEALDSLLKGLKRYDKYIELATMYGIKSDMDYVRTQIFAELKNVFKLSEEEAVKINSYDNLKEYSLKVYDVVLENMNN